MSEPFFTPIKGFETSSFAGSTLVLPIVSTGNVPQLTVDLVIATLPGLRRIGCLSSDDLVPFVGALEEEDYAREADGDNGGVVTALEVFGQVGDEDRGVFWIQQRSPILKSKRAGFLKKLTDWIKESQFGKMLILSSLDAASRTDNLDTDSKHHHLPLPSVVSIPFPSLSDNLPPYFSAPPERNPYMTAEDQSKPESQPILPSLPGSGILSPLLLQLHSPLAQSSDNASEQSHEALLPIGVVLSFVLEGENRSDALEMAKVVDMVLDLGVERAGAGGWQEPGSWEGFGGGHGEVRRADMEFS